MFVTTASRATRRRPTEQNTSGVFARRADAVAAYISGSINTIISWGYYTVGDGGCALYKRDTSLTTGGFQSADGTYWTIVPSGGYHNIRAFGCKGDASTNDTTALQNAASLGLPLFVPPGGTFLVDSVTLSAAGQRIFGEGKQSILRARTAGTNFITLAASYAGVSNLQLQGCETDAANSIFGIYTAAGATYYGIQIDRVLFSGASSSVGFNNAIKLDDSCQIPSVTGCIVERLWGNTSGHGYGVLLGNCYSPIITGNQFKGSSGRGRHAVYVSAGTHDGIVSSNAIDSMDYDGITCYSTDLQPATHSIVIANNTLINTPAISSLTSGAIATAVNCYDITIANNEIRQSQACGIKIDGTSSVNMKRIICNGNRVLDSGWIGIDYVATSGGSIVNNIVVESSRSSAGTYSNIRLVSDGTTGTSNIFIGGNESTGTSYARSPLQFNTTTPVPTAIMGTNYFPTCNLTGIEWGTSGLEGTVPASKTYVDQTIGAAQNVGIATSVAASALTIALKTADGSTPSSTNRVRIPSHPGTGTVSPIDVQAALSIVVPSATSIGTSSGVQSPIYVYAINNSGTIELAVSLFYWGQNGIVTTTAISGGAVSTTMYSTTARTNVPYCLLGVAYSTQATAGTWATNPTAIQVAPLKLKSYQFRADRSTNQTGWATATFTKVNLNSESFDPDNVFDSTTNFRFVCEEPGNYSFTGAITSNGGIKCTSYVYKNGSISVTGQTMQTGDLGVSAVDGPIALVPGQTVELYGYQASGGSDAFYGVAGYTWLAGKIQR